MLLVPKKEKTNRQITNRLNIDAILRCHLAAGMAPSPAAQCRAMPANHSDCRCTIPRNREPVAGARYTMFKKYKDGWAARESRNQC